MLAIRGFDAVDKARKTADALLARTRRQMRAAGFADYADVLVELLGAESLYGPHARAAATREVVLRIAVRHQDRRALEFLRREVTSPGTSMGPGTRGHFGGRSDVRPVVRLFSCFVAKAITRPELVFAGTASPVPHNPVPAPVPPVALPAVADQPLGDTVAVKLVELAWARSGDKGDDLNIGVIARKADYLPALRAGLTTDRVRAWMAHLVAGPVERYEMPGLGAFNFVLHHALGGGGMASLRSDPLGKSFAQILLEIPIGVPAAIAVRDGLSHDAEPSP